MTQFIVIPSPLMLCRVTQSPEGKWKVGLDRKVFRAAHNTPGLYTPLSPF